MTIRTGAGRRLEIDGLYNARDLGGHHTAHGPTRYRRIVRSEAPVRLQADGQRQLAEYGVIGHLDLRSDREASAEPSPLAGTRGYRRVPILNEAAMRRVSTLSDGTQLMEYMLVERAPMIGRSLRTLLELSEHGGVLLHCRAGKDRTGLLAALLLANAGVSEEAIAVDHARSQPNLEPLFAIWAGAAAAEEERALVTTRKFEATREAMLLTLASFTRRHATGVHGYLRHAGLISEEIGALRNLLLYSSDPIRAA